MSDKPQPDVPEAAGHPLSGLTIPPDIRFSDDRQGVESRMLIAGHAERLADLVREHAPIEEVRQQVRVVIEVMTDATNREITRLVRAANGRAN